MVDTVLIATSERLRALAEHPECRDASSFSDSDALVAFDAILRERPRRVIVDESFAFTPRGTALIHRIRTEPALASCEVRIVEDAERPLKPWTEAESGPAPTGPLDPRGTRHEPRFELAYPITVMIDGSPARLTDLSLGGAQVVAIAALRPQQRVRVSLPAPDGPIRLSASVRWAAFEIPAEGPCYRAGLAFLDGDRPAIERFVDASTRRSDG